jgi:hypothetical protein
MIKFNVKALFNKSKPEETSVILTTEVEKTETPKEIFDAAVASVIKVDLEKSVEKALFILIHGQESYDQTKEFRGKLTSDEEEYSELLIKYPKAILRYSQYGTLRGKLPSLVLETEDLLKYLTEEAYTQVYGETE